MYWELLSIAFYEYSSRLRRAEEERRAEQVQRASHPAPRRLQRLRDRLGHWLVAWGEALQTPIDTPRPELTVAQPK